MNLQRILITLLLTVVICFSCSEKPVDVYSVKQIPGLWKWESTCGGFDYTCTFPSKSAWASIEFTADGKYIEMHNDTLFLESTYDLQVYDDVYGTVVIQDPYRSLPVAVINSRLLITRGELTDTYYKVKD